MALVLNLEPDLEKEIQTEAKLIGIDIESLVQSTLKDRFGSTIGSENKNRFNNRSLPPHLNKEESELLMKINIEVPTELWDNYDMLVAKRESGALTSEEQENLIELYDQIESIHFERVKNAAELAKLRNIPLMELMAQLGIRPRNVTS